MLVWQAIQCQTKNYYFTFHFRSFSFSNNSDCPSPEFCSNTLLYTFTNPLGRNYYIRLAVILMDGVRHTASSHVTLRLMRPLLSSLVTWALMFLTTPTFKHHLKVYQQ